MADIHIEQIRGDLTWRIRQEAMYPHLPISDMKLENDAEGMHFGLFADSRLVSVVSLFEEGTVSQFRKFATMPLAQGKGYGTQLLRYILKFASDMGATKIWCNARVSATGFYEKFGFAKTTERFRKHDLDFVIMELQLDNSMGLIEP